MKITKKIQWATYASIDYDICLDCWHFKLHLKSHFKIKTNKGQSKKKRERNYENNCLICFLRGQFLDSKPKTRVCDYGLLFLPTLALAHRILRSQFWLLDIIFFDIKSNKHFWCFVLLSLVFTETNTFIPGHLEYSSC